jgi:hypothetical protein
LLREQSKSPGNFNDDINFRTRSLTDILPSESHEVRTIISGAGLSPEASSNKDNAAAPRCWSLVWFVFDFELGKQTF